MFSQVQSIPSSSAFALAAPLPSDSNQQSKQQQQQHQQQQQRSSETSSRRDDPKLVNPTTTTSPKRRNNESLLSRSFGSSVNDLTTLRQNSEPTSITYSGYLLKRSNEPLVPPEQIGAQLQTEVGPTSAPILIGSYQQQPPPSSSATKPDEYEQPCYYYGDSKRHEAYYGRGHVQHIRSTMPDTTAATAAAAAAVERKKEKQQRKKSALELVAAFFGLEPSDSEEDEEDESYEQMEEETADPTFSSISHHNYHHPSSSSSSSIVAKQPANNAIAVKAKTSPVLIYNSHQPSSYLPAAAFLAPGPDKQQLLSGSPSYYHRVESEPLKHSTRDMEGESSSESHHPADVIDPDDGHIWRAKYCILENGILYFYRNANDGNSPEAKLEREQASLFHNHQDHNTNTTNNNTDTDASSNPNHTPAASSAHHHPSYFHHESDLLAHSPMPRNPFLMADRPNCGVSVHESSHHHGGSHHPPVPMWEKRVALDKVGAVRSAQFEYGDFSFILMAIDCEDNPNSVDNNNNNNNNNNNSGDATTSSQEESNNHHPDCLILRASSTDEMNEWLFQIHRSLVPFMKKIVNMAKSNGGIRGAPTTRRPEGGGGVALHRKIPSNEPFQYYKPSAPIQMPKMTVVVPPPINNKTIGFSPELSSDLSLSHGHGRSGFHRRKIKDKSTPASTPGGGSSPITSHGWAQAEPYLLETTTVSNDNPLVTDIQKSDQINKHATTTAYSNFTTKPDKVSFVKKDVISSSDGGIQIMRTTTTTKTTKEKLQHNYLHNKKAEMEKDSPDVVHKPKLSSSSSSSNKPPHKSDHPTIKVEKATSTAKYIPPHLRKKSGKYVPPHLRNKTQPGKSKNTLDTSSIDQSSQKTSIEESGISAKVSNRSDIHQKGGVNNVKQEESYFSHSGGFGFDEDEDAYGNDPKTKSSRCKTKSENKNDFSTTEDAKLGGCADPSIVVGSILDSIYRSRKAPKVGKVHAKPYGYDTSTIKSVKQSGSIDSEKKDDYSTDKVNWEVGAISECGIRDSNEDSYLILNDLRSVLLDCDNPYHLESPQDCSSEDFEQTFNNLFPNLQMFGLFAIFDGHLGNQAARFAAEKLPFFLKKAICFMNPDPPLPKKETAEKIIAEALLDLDTYFCRLCLEDGRDWECGATALVSLVVDDAIVVAHLGDSSGVLCSASKTNPNKLLDGDRCIITEFQNNLKDTGWSVLDPDENDTSESKSSNVNLEQDFQAEMPSIEPAADIFWKEIVDIHSPDREDERRRIESANGWITTETEIPISQLQRMDLFDNDVVDILKRCFSDRFNMDHASHGCKKGHAEPGRLLNIFRICGELAVSRSLGDRDFKAASNIPLNLVENNNPNPIIWDGPCFLHYADDHSRKFMGDIVSPIPETQIFQININGFFDEFLLLACDGLWDVMDADDAVRVTRNLLFEKGWNARKAAARLAELAIHLGSSDNITVILIHFRREES